MIVRSCSVDMSETTPSARPGRDEVVPVYPQSAENRLLHQRVVGRIGPVEPHRLGQEQGRVGDEAGPAQDAARHAVGANVATSMSLSDAMCTDERSHVDGSSAR
jgi:hypothetical protein